MYRTILHGGNSSGKTASVIRRIRTWLKYEPEKYYDKLIWVLRYRNKLERYTIGVDLGTGKDYTVWSVPCRKCHNRICEQEPVTEADIENWWKVMGNYDPIIHHPTRGEQMTRRYVYIYNGNLRCPRWKHDHDSDNCSKCDYYVQHIQGAVICEWDQEVQEVPQ